MYKYSLLDPNWLAHKANNELIQRYSPYMTGTVYDLGCGTRPYEKDILKYANNYVGVDWCNTMHGLHADIEADLNSLLPIEDGVADTVVAFQVLEHLYEPQIMLNEAFRILRKGGRIFLSVPFQWWVHEAPFDYFRYTRFGLQYMFDKAGYTRIEIEAPTGFWFMWVLKFNYHSMRYLRGPKLLRWLAKAVLTPIWFFGQSITPILDKYDRNEAETTGYFVTAHKP